MAGKKLSDSSGQLHIEQQMLFWLEEQHPDWVRVAWQPLAAELDLSSTLKRLKPDGAWRTASGELIVAECYARIRNLNSGHLLAPIHLQRPSSAATAWRASFMTTVTALLFRIPATAPRTHAPSRAPNTSSGARGWWRGCWSQTLSRLSMPLIPARAAWGRRCRRRPHALAGLWIPLRATRTMVVCDHKVLI
jgi:hypothetical protein